MAKHNMAEVLRRELGRASWGRERVALGTATDAYQPCEGRVRGLWKRLEPGAPPPAKRLEIMRGLTDAGVPCAVYIAPVIPGLTDSEASRAAIVAAAREHGTTALWAGPLRLASLVKEHFFGFLGENVPELLAWYERAYFRADAPRDYRAVLEARIDRILDQYGCDRARAKAADEDREAESLKPGTAERGQLPLPL